MLINALKHFGTITKHKILVFILCCKAGQIWRGFMHDWSKYSFTEFWESVKYYKGTYSPIIACKEENGYSKAWLHHKGRNKHHPEYWYDYNTKEKTLMMPYKYAVEMVCDNLAAGMVYEGKNWNNSTQLNHLKRIKGEQQINEQISKFRRLVFQEVSDKGIQKAINKANLKRIYNECLLEDKVKI